jgi:hypothetical protein
MSSVGLPEGAGIVSPPPAGTTSLTWWCMHILSIPFPPQLCELLGYWGPLERIALCAERDTGILLVGDGTGWVRADCDAWSCYSSHPRVEPVLTAYRVLSQLVQGLAWLVWDRAHARSGLERPRQAQLILASCAQLAIDSAGEIEDREEYDAEVRRWYALWADPPQHVREKLRAGQAARLTAMLAWLDERGGAR